MTLQQIISILLDGIFQNVYFGHAGLRTESGKGRSDNSVCFNQNTVYAESGYKYVDKRL